MCGGTGRAPRLPRWPPAELGEGLYFISSQGNPLLHCKVWLCPLHLSGGMRSPSGGTQCPFPVWPLLENSSDRPSSKRFLLLSVVAFFFPQQLVGPAQCVGNIPKLGRCPSYHWLILSLIPSDSLEGSVVPAALSAPDQDTQPLSLLEVAWRGCLQRELPAAQLKYIPVQCKVLIWSSCARAVVLKICNFVAFTAG